MTTVHIAAALLVAVAIFCRARHMDAFTPTRAKVQHGAALVGALLSLPIFAPPEWGAALLGLSMYVFLALDARRTSDHQGSTS